MTSDVQNLQKSIEAVKKAAIYAKPHQADAMLDTLMDWILQIERRIATLEGK